jgi:hypothetical protein
MPRKKSWFKMRPTLAVLMMALMLPLATWGASTYKVLYKFTGGADEAGWPSRRTHEGVRLMLKLVPVVFCGSGNR